MSSTQPTPPPPTKFLADDPQVEWFQTCAHLCPHHSSPNAKAPGVFTWYRGTGSPIYSHLKATKTHPHCNSNCPAYHGEAKRNATLYESLRCLHQYASTKPLPKKEKDFLEKKEWGHWKGFIDNAAAIDPYISSVFSDGSIGSPSDATWFEKRWMRQYPDLLTPHFPRRRPFDSVAAKEGRAAIAGCPDPSPTNPTSQPDASPATSILMAGSSGRSPPTPPARQQSPSQASGPSGQFSSPSPPRQESPPPPASPVRQESPPPPASPVRQESPPPPASPVRQESPLTSLSPGLPFRKTSPPLAGPSGHRHSPSPTRDMPASPMHLEPHSLSDADMDMVDDLATASEGQCRSPSVSSQRLVTQSDPSSGASITTFQRLENHLNTKVMFRRNPGDENAGFQHFAAVPGSPFHGPNGLPKKIGWVEYGMHGARPPITNLQRAKRVLDDPDMEFFWINVTRNMDCERGRYIENKFLSDRRWNRFVWFDPDSPIAERDFFMWEWIDFLIHLAGAGSDFELLQEDAFIKGISSGKSTIEKHDVSSFEMFFGGSDFWGTKGYKPPRKAYIDGLKQLMMKGVVLWPNPFGDELAARKVVTLRCLAPIVLELGGVPDLPIVMDDLEMCIRAVSSGHWVVKREYSDSNQHVIQPLNVKGMRESWKETAKSFGDSSYRPSWFAVPFNPEILSQGEVRCIFVFGQLVEMWHTTVVPVKETGTTRSLRTCRAHGHIRPLANIAANGVGMDKTGLLASQTIESAWFSTDEVFRQDGEAEVRAFATGIYDHLVHIESVLGSGRNYTAASLRIACRVDISVRRSSSGEFKLMLNEVQQGLFGHFRFTAVSGSSFPFSFVEGVKLGMFAGIDVRGLADEDDDSMDVT